MKKARPNDKELVPEPEVCTNPWKIFCGDRDIAVIVLVKGRYYPICRSCWEELGESDLEWNGTAEGEESG